MFNYIDLTFMNPKWKKARAARKSRSAKPSKNLRKAVNTIISKAVETKTINCPSVSGGTTNTNGLIYPSGSGLQYLCQDVFRVQQGVNDSTALGALNRIGDKIKGVGFLCDYYIHGYNTYAIGGNQLQIPYIKVRMTIWKQAFGTPLLNLPLLYDTNFNNVNTSTLQPINWDEGYVKDVLFDKVFIIKSNYPQVDSATLTPYPTPNVFHFKKYFKYDQFIKFADNNTTSPNSTDKPIYITLAAEVDEANAFVPSGVRLLNTTGYTRAWFKDA